MLAGPILRTRKNQKKYAHHVKHVATECDFCAFQPGDKQVLKEFPSFWMVDNLFGYDMWDSAGVAEHYMIVPKRHVESLGQLNAAEAKEYMDLLATFEKEGYSIYARAPQSITKSVPHQHTHLIKSDNKRKRALFFIRKPHFMIYI